MPSSDRYDSLYYSIDVGNMHFIAYDSELYWFDTRERQTQMEKWLREDLAKANQNRDKVPWIVAMGHRPLYCSAKFTTDDDCDLDGALAVGARARRATSHSTSATDNPLRTYLEEIFCEGGVDLVIQAHVHDYERILPVYKNKVWRGNFLNPYDNPPVPVYVVSGAGGCDENIAPHSVERGITPWDAAYVHDYGLGLMTLHNNTHLTYKQYTASTFRKNGGWGAPPADEFTLIREHGRNGPHGACKRL